MMTPKELQVLQTGTRVQWRDASGKLSDNLGTVIDKAFGRSIRWDDGQITANSDDWALRHVERWFAHEVSV